MCSSGQCLFLPRAELQQMDEVSTFVILIYGSYFCVKWSSWIYITLINGKGISL
ncbi:hypothetical protein [Bacillus manliponensis]|uniref:hypothetical protein n=1 Tax=Bacillus manliponensis TaxID=574376 RepID=UPI0035189C0C